MNPPEEQFSVEPPIAKNKLVSIVSIGAGVRNKLALGLAAVLVLLALFQLSAQEARKDAVVKVPIALEVV